MSSRKLPNDSSGKNVRDPYRDPKKERRDMNASLAGGAIALIVLFLGLQNPLFSQKFNSDLALLLPGSLGGGEGIPVEAMSGGALALFIVAEVVKALAVAAIAILVIMVVRSYTKGEFFTFRTARRVTAIGWLSFIYPVGLFIQRMGENMVASELDLDIWFDRAGNFFGSFLPIWYVLAMTISMLGVMLYRAARMQQDQEGLI
nr:DUF2975 domain-containing protein [Corynebacterium lactis]